MDVGVAVLEQEDQSGDVQHAQRRGAGDADRSHRRAASAASLLARLLDEAENLGAARIVPAALVGQGDAPRGAGEQRRSHRILQLLQLPADRRLPGPQLARHGRQAAALRHADEGAHPLQRDPRSIHFPALSYPLPMDTG